MRSTNAVPPVKFSRGRWRWIVLPHLPTSNCSSSTIMETDILFARNPSTSPRLHSTSSTLWIFSCRYYLKKSKFSSFSTLSIFIFFFFSCIRRTRPVSKFFTNNLHLRTCRYSCIVNRTRTGTRRSNSFPCNPCWNLD